MTLTRPIKTFLAALFIFVFISLIAFGRHAAAQGAVQRKGTVVASLMADAGVQPIRAVKVPSFSLKDVHDKTFRLEDHAGKVLLLNFWTTH